MLTASSGTATKTAKPAKTASQVKVAQETRRSGPARSKPSMAIATSTGTRRLTVKQSTAGLGRPGQQGPHRRQGQQRQEGKGGGKKGGGHGAAGGLEGGAGLNVCHLDEFGALEDETCV